MSEKYHSFGFVPDNEIATQYDYLAQSAYAGINEVIYLSGNTPVHRPNFILSPEQLSELSTMNQQVNGQVSLESIYPTLVRSGYATPSNPKYLLLSKDLSTENANFVFGMSVTETGLSLQSVYRFLSLKKADQQLCARHIARHEYGHLMGLDSSTISSQDRRSGLYLGHCLNECTMHQVMSVQETIKLANSLKHKKLAGFCIECASVLRDINS